jgi:hypothetical protein
LLAAEKLPQAVIIVGQDASLPEQFAAQELCRYIQRIRIGMRYVMGSEWRISSVCPILKWLE